MVLDPRLDEEDGSPPGPVTDPTPRTLPPTGQVEKLQLLSAGLGRPIPLVYGLHLVAGLNILRNETATAGEQIIFNMYGQGEWDGLDVLWASGKRLYHKNTNIVHFHPGKDGESGTESAPQTPNQKICSFWPSGFTPKVHFSQMAYLAVKLPPDPEIPGPVPILIARCRTRKVRIFDANGVQTAFQYSTNPADQGLDAIITTELKPHGAVNEALTAAEKALIDFAGYVTWRDKCNEAIASGEKRWESHPANVTQTDLRRSLDQLLILGSGFIRRKAGKIDFQPDEARASVLTLLEDKFGLGTFSLGRKASRDLANKFVANFRDINSGLGKGTIDTTGVAVIGTGTNFTEILQAASPLELADGPQVGQIRDLASAPSIDTVAILSSAFTANQDDAKWRNPQLDFAPATKKLDDEAHQADAGRTSEAVVELGGNTTERAERLLRRVKVRTLDFADQVELIAAPGQGADDLLPGEIIATYDSQGMQTTGTFEILTQEFITEGELEGGVRLVCQEFDGTKLDDAVGTQQDPAPSLPPVDPTPIPTPVSPPAVGTWVSFRGEKGFFFGELSPSGLLPAPWKDLLVVLVTLASNDSFSQDVVAYKLDIGIRRFEIDLPLATRFAKASWRFAGGAVSAAVEYKEGGTTTSKKSGHPVDELAPNDEFDPTQPEIDPITNKGRTNEPGSLPFGFQSGSARDGDAISFEPPYDNPPVVRVLPMNAVLFNSTDSAFTQKGRYEAVDITVNGFTVKAVTYADAATSNFSVVPTGTAPNQVATKNRATEALDDTYIYTFDVTINGTAKIASGITLEFWERPSGGTWVKRGQRVYWNSESTPVTLNNETFSIVIDGAVNNHEFKIVEGTQFDQGGDLDNFDKLEWNEATITERSATPDVADKIQWFAYEGETG